MNRFLTFLLFLTGGVCFGQSTDKFEPFTSTDYPANNYKIKLDTATFTDFKIEIRQVKNIDPSRWDSSAFYCRGWLTVKRGNKIITQKFFKSIEPVGGCSGLFLPDVQPRKDYFVLSKFGDYDGSILILDTTGTLIENFGGVFYVSKDKRFLFSNYDSDAAGLTVYDFDKHFVILSTSDEITNSLGAWYFQDGKYMAMIINDSTEDETITKVSVFDFKTNKLVISQVGVNYLKDENKLKAYNELKYAKECNCGR